MLVTFKRRYVFMRSSAFLAFLLLSAPAHAAVVTLIPEDAIEVDFTNFGDIVYENAGFTYQQTVTYPCRNCLFNLHDDSGLQETIITRVDGQRFNAISAAQTVVSRLYRSADTAAPQDDGQNPDFTNDYLAWAKASKPSYLNFGWFGYRAGSLVATYQAFGNDPDVITFATLAFSPEFADLDTLIARYFSPDGSPFQSIDAGFDVTEPGTEWIDFWSGELFVASLTLDVGETVAPVPLPAGLSLLAMGLGALALAGRRRAA
jgi:hypothetical protein